jgi:acyl-CoA thioesterase-2
VLELERVDEGRYLAPHVLTGAPDAAFGGQLLAQIVVAAGHELADKPLTSIHCVFSRPARVDAPIHIDVDVMHEGRNAGSALVTLHQGGPPCVRGLALAVAPQQREQARHATGAPDVGAPADARPTPSRLDELELRVVGGVDLAHEDGDGPAELYVWARAHGLPDAPNAAKAMIAFAGEPHFVGTALRPHAGLSVSQSFTGFAPAVVSHGVAYHDAVAESEWWLYALSVPQLANGRLFGRGDVFAEDGRLVASVWQENLMRPLT